MIDFYTVENKDSGFSPKWSRSYGVAETGEVYLPILSGDPEHLIHAMVTTEGFKTYTYLDHLFIPSTWIIANMPELREFCENVIAYAHDPTIQETALEK